MSKNRWYRNLMKRARGQAGVTLVEMVVSLCIFAIVSTLFTVAIVQYLHTTSADTIRSRSSTEIATSVRTLDRYVRNAVGVRDDGDAVTLVTYDADGVKPVRGNRIYGSHVDGGARQRLRFRGRAHQTV